MNKTFKKGYHCDITSCENDGDVYKTKQFFTEDLEIVKAIYNFLDTYVSPSSDSFEWQGEDYESFGNNHNQDDDLLEEIWLSLGLSELNASGVEWMHTYIGYWESWDDAAWRAFDSMNVYYVHEDVVFEEVLL